jgi:hypothetical protein
VALTGSVIAFDNGTPQGDGPLFTISIAAAIAIATSNYAAMDQYVNQIVQQAEADLPEYTRVELNISGWVVPGIGSVGQSVADAIQQQWVEGNIYDPATGETPGAWPEYPGQVAWYDPTVDILTLRWVKAQLFVVWMAAAILIVIGALYLYHLIAGWFGGGSGTGYGLLKYVATGSGGGGGGGGGSGGWSTTTKVLVIGGLAAAGITGGIVWYHLSLAKAGASRSDQTIIVER